MTDNIRSVASLTSTAAAKIVEAGVAQAARRQLIVCIVVLDEAGRFLAGRSMDGVTNAAFEVAFAKARHSANFRRPTKFQQDLLMSKNALPVLAIPGMLPVEGGLQVIVDGNTIGSVGVSGASSEDDGQIASAAVAALKGAGSRDVRGS